MAVTLLTTPVALALALTLSAAHLMVAQAGATSGNSIGRVLGKMIFGTRQKCTILAMGTGHGMIQVGTT